MSDALDDLVRLRLAGYYEAGHEDPEEAECHQPVTQPGTLPTSGQLVNRLHKAEAILAALAGVDPYDESEWDICSLCGLDVSNGHAPDCPWRQAAEYIDGLEGKS